MKKEENPILCPHCGEPLVIKAYFEASAEFEAVRNEKGELEIGEEIWGTSTNPDFDDEPSDYECAECCENISKDLFNKI